MRETKLLFLTRFPESVRLSAGTVPSPVRLWNPLLHGKVILYGINCSKCCSRCYRLFQMWQSNALHVFWQGI